jgi:RNA polymerase sigma-70 factor (ECF subfamily)
MNPADPAFGEHAKPRLALVPPSAPAEPEPTDAEPTDAEPASEEPVRELWASHGRALLRFACKLTLGDQYRAEDIVQETLLRAWRHPEITGSGHGTLRPWLFTVARRIAIDMWRARARDLDHVGEPCPDVADPADHIEAAITAMDVRNALAALSPDHREVITELYFNNRSVIEAAAILKVPPGTVKSRAHYATRRLRQILAAPCPVTPENPEQRLTA